MPRPGAAPVARALASSSGSWWRLVELRGSLGGLQRYGLALLAVAAAHGLRFAFGLRDGFPFITYYPAVMVAAVLLGRGPGLVATGASTLLAWLAILANWPSVDPGPQGIASLALFAVMGSLIAALAERYYHAQVRAEEAERELTLLAGAHGEIGLFRSMQEGLAYHRMIYDERGRPCDYEFIRVNAAFERLTGLRGVEGRRATEVVPGIRDAQPDLIQRYGQVARSGVADRFETEVPALGTWFSVAAYSPRPDHFVAIFDDITERKRAAAQLEEERERLAVTLASVGDAVIATDTVGRVTVMNETAAQLTGWGVGEALGRPLAEVFRIVNEDTRLPVESPIDRVIREGAVVGLANHTSLITRDGRERAIADSAAPIRDQGGALRGVVMVFRDQAVERRAEKLVRSRLDLLEFAPARSLQEVLRRTLDEVGHLTGSPIGFYHFVEPDQRTLSLQAWSTRTLREFCNARGEGLHYPIDQAGVWADAVRQRRPLIHNDYATLPGRRGLPEGHAAVLRELVVPIIRDERVVAVLGVGNKPTDYTAEDAEIVSYLADACWEMTARKRAEEARDQLEAQLRQAQKLESIGRLAGGVAHDFNNLLTVILSCAETLGTATEGTAAHNDVEELRRAGERARDLTRRLLAFARKQVSSPIQLDLNTAVRSVERLLTRVLGDDIELRIDLQTGLWPVLFDPGLLEQVLLNLAVNARDAMPEGGTLTLESRNAVVEPGRGGRSDDRIGDWVRIFVRDTGVGMSADVRARIFEPFFTTKEVGKGTGLGLAMVHGIVTQASGHVHVESEPGQGTTFEICLPRAVPGASPARVAPEQRARSSPPAGETILVVEDDHTVRAVMVRALQGAGYRVLEADGAEQALDRARTESGPVHLVVSDVQMPGQGGRALGRALRALRPEARILFVSGFLGGDLDQALEGDGFLPKPFNQETLLAEVRAVLDRTPFRGGLALGSGSGAQA